jgi:hypothetical protein
VFDPDHNPELDDFHPETLVTYGTLFTVSDYLDMVECGGFIDYDGFGHPSSGTHEDPRHIIKPSDGATKIPPQATHICWYNR